MSTFKMKSKDALGIKEKEHKEIVQELQAVICMRKNGIAILQEEEDRLRFRLGYVCGQIAELKKIAYGE